MDYNELIQNLTYCADPDTKCMNCKYYDVENCQAALMNKAALALRQMAAAAPSFVANGEIMSVEPDIYDQEERHENCTVQILRNRITGAFSFGWWENGEVRKAEDGEG